MARLYELTGEILLLAEKLDEIDGLDEQTIRDTLSSSQELINFEKKAASIARMMRNWESNVEEYKTEIERLQSRKTALENKVKHFKQYIQIQMETAGLNNIDCGTSSLSIRANKPSVVIEKEDLIPATYATIKTETKYDKNRIYADIKAGKNVPGCRLSQSKSLIIR